MSLSGSQNPILRIFLLVERRTRGTRAARHSLPFPSPSKHVRRWPTTYRIYLPTYPITFVYNSLQDEE